MTDQNINIGGAVPALQRSLEDIVQEYEAKRAAVPALCKEYETFHRHIDMQATVGGQYAGRVYSYHPSLYQHAVEESLLESAWTHVYKGLGIDKIAPAADRKRFDLSLKNPPDFTLDNIRATFGDYLLNPRQHILRGLAEAFCSLDPAFKSHSRVKIGVSGLPKRVIVTNVIGDWGVSGYGESQLRDVVNALHVALGEPHIEYGELSDWIKAARKDKTEFKGLELRVFKNGNAHLFFKPHRLMAINDALAEFYGDVLPDAPAETSKKRPGTAVAKDLQFYPTPARVADKAVDEIYMPDDGAGKHILEPSCGDGALLDALAKHLPRAKLTGIEVDPGRAEIARTKGYRVLTGNFLASPPPRIFDAVVMNPPFYGTHWKKHLLQGLSALKPGGKLVCILPASAHVDGHLKDLGLDYTWIDLPTASFAASGTNIATGYARLFAARQ